MKNPYVSLLKTSWKYARSERKKLVLVYVMFVLANIIFSMQPLLLGWFVNKLQSDTSDIFKYSFMYVGGYLASKTWRMESARSGACDGANAGIYHKQKFYPGKISPGIAPVSQVAPGSPQRRNHQPDSKAYESLREFFDRGFTNLYTLTKFVFSVTAIVYFSPLFGTIAVALGLATVYVISRFDASFIKTLSEMNQKEHEVSSNLFDSLSNIRTVITLRLERSMESGLLKKIRRVFRPFRQNAIINEWKWFTADMMITFIYGIVVVGFVYQHWTPGTVFKVGALVTLLGYINQFTSVFQNVAMQYTSLVQYHTHVNEVSGITDAYVVQHPDENIQRFPRKWSAWRSKGSTSPIDTFMMRSTCRKAFTTSGFR